MKEFRFLVEFEDSSCDFRTAKGLDSDNAQAMLIAMLDKQHESKMIKGKKAIRVKAQL